MFVLAAPRTLSTMHDASRLALFGLNSPNRSTLKVNNRTLIMC